MFAGNFDGFLHPMIGKLFPVPVLVHILRVMVRIVPIRDRRLFSVVHNLRVSIVPIRRDKLFPVSVRIESNPEIAEISVRDIWLVLRSYDRSQAWIWLDEPVVFQTIQIRDFEIREILGN